MTGNTPNDPTPSQEVENLLKSLPLILGDQFDISSEQLDQLSAAGKKKKKKKGSEEKEKQTCFTCDSDDIDDCTYLDLPHSECVYCDEKDTNDDCNPGFSPDFPCGVKDI